MEDFKKQLDKMPIFPNINHLMKQFNDFYLKTVEVEKKRNGPNFPNNVWFYTPKFITDQESAILKNTFLVEMEPDAQNDGKIIWLT